MATEELSYSDITAIQSQINRLTAAKNDIAAAITNKGVTVPSGTKLDGMAALIGSIESGGSGGGSSGSGLREITPEEVCIYIKNEIQYTSGAILTLVTDVEGVAIIYSIYMLNGDTITNLSIEGVDTFNLRLSDGYEIMLGRLQSYSGKGNINIIAETLEGNLILNVYADKFGYERSGDLITDGAVTVHFYAVGLD